jgi:hypothetical protein
MRHKTLLPSINSSAHQLRPNIMSPEEQTVPHILCKFSLNLHDSTYSTDSSPRYFPPTMGYPLFTPIPSSDHFATVCIPLEFGTPKENTKISDAAWERFKERLQAQLRRALISHPAIDGIIKSEEKRKKSLDLPDNRQDLTALPEDNSLEEPPACTDPFWSFPKPHSPIPPWEESDSSSSDSEHELDFPRDFEKAKYPPRPPVESSEKPGIVRRHLGRESGPSPEPRERKRVRLADASKTVKNHTIPSPQGRLQHFVSLMDFHKKARIKRAQENRAAAERK